MRGLEFVALRYANVYGPRQDPHGEAGVVAIFAQRLLRDAAVTINGDGLQTRDYVYVDDVVRANLAAMSSRTPDAVNVGTGVESDVDGLYERLRRISGTEARAVHGDAKPGEQRRSCLDIGHARTALGWEPSVALDEGLRRTTDFSSATSERGSIPPASLRQLPAWERRSATAAWMPAAPANAGV